MTDASRSPIRIATRASRLALWQADHVAGLLRRSDPGVQVEVVEVSTVGDRVRTEPLSKMGGAGVFVREVQAAVLDRRADIAVHSLKDLPTVTATGLALAGVPQRGPRFDVLVLPSEHQRTVASLDELPPGARIGTGSLRRQAQLLHHRPDLVMSEIRGNVETRVRKLDEGEFEGVVLAQAGLERLEMADRVSLVLQPPLMFPAVGQAALGIECRADDEPTIALLKQLTDPIAMAEVTAERSCLAQLRAGCHAPVGVLTELRNDNLLQLQAVVLSADGTERIEAAGQAPIGEAEDLGRRVADELLRQGAARLIDPS